MDEDWQGSFLKANANVDYMANRLADCLRNCMRAVAAGDPASPCYRAVRDFEVLLKLIVRSADVPLYALFEKAIDELRPKHDDISRDEVSSEWRADRYYERSIIGAAESGLQFLVESSCVDNAAGGRASTRKRNFSFSNQECRGGSSRDGAGGQRPLAVIKADASKEAAQESGIAAPVDLPTRAEDYP